MGKVKRGSMKEEQGGENFKIDLLGMMMMMRRRRQGKGKKKREHKW
jgi:hypothetical protein